MNTKQMIDEIEVYIDTCRAAGVLGGGNMIKVNREEILAMLDTLHDEMHKSDGRVRVGKIRSYIEKAESAGLPGAGKTLKINKKELLAMFDQLYDTL